jgi:hypothetical protein
MSKMKRLFVGIDVNEDFLTSENESARSAVVKELNILQIGEFVGFNQDRGGMGFTYRVEDEQAALNAIESALSKHLFGRRYFIKSDDVVVRRRWKR